MNKYKAIIADDEIKNQEVLFLLLKEYCPSIQVVATFSTLDDTVFFLENNEIDIAFLDIAFGNKTTSFEILDRIEKSDDLNIVFVTAYNEYAVRAFEYGATHYLLKPVNPEQLQEVIQRIEKNKAENSSENFAIPPINEDRFISLSDKGAVNFININDIEYVKANGSYTEFHLINGEEYSHSRNLKNFEKFVDGNPNFIRIHKSFIANKNYIVSVNKTHDGTVTMKSGEQLAVTMPYRTLVDIMEQRV